jgi:hypothetical protein
MLARLTTAAITLTWAALACGDYLEVTKNAYIYAEANRHSERLDYIQLEEGSPIVYLLLVGRNLENGYYNVSLIAGSKVGWIYKSRVRLRSRDPPNGQSWEDDDDDDEEILPDVEETHSGMPWPEDLDTSAIVNPDDRCENAK